MASPWEPFWQSFIGWRLSLRGPAIFKEADDSISIYVCLALPSHGLYTVKTADLRAILQAAIGASKRSALSHRTPNTRGLLSSASKGVICPQ